MLRAVNLTTSSQQEFYIQYESEALLKLTYLEHHYFVLCKLHSKYDQAYRKPSASK